ncbi:hypothetical protein [Virgibacillus sp. CBA3643]|uniref:hypothetical protein n=1 Tax=Virgibacillus sp. CBA3643 TaxID=2942278 RepID=UPI0035A2F6A3
MDLKQANNYLSVHMFAEKWTQLEDDKKQSVLNYAETILHSHFNFREGYEETDNYHHALYEQAIHLLNFEKERLLMQQQGVTYLAVDGITQQMTNSIVSPVAKGFLKNITKRHIGDAI